jgi:hypothetical protein
MIMSVNVTIDTNVLPATQLIELCNRLDYNLAVVTVTEREIGSIDLSVSIQPLRKIHEMALWDEGTWDNAIWGSSVDMDNMEKIISIISNSSIPRNRSNLSIGQWHIIRDALIFEAHIREKGDIFVSNDRKGYIKNGRREKLEMLSGTKIFTEEEFLNYCNDNAA